MACGRRLCDIVSASEPTLRKSIISEGLTKRRTMFSSHFQAPADQQSLALDRNIVCSRYAGDLGAFFSRHYWCIPDITMLFSAHSKSILCLWGKNPQVIPQESKNLLSITLRPVCSRRSKVLFGNRGGYCGRPRQ